MAINFFNLPFNLRLTSHRSLLHVIALYNKKAQSLTESSLSVMFGYGEFLLVYCHMIAVNHLQ